MDKSKNILELQDTFCFQGICEYHLHDQLVDLLRSPLAENLNDYY